MIFRRNIWMPTVYRDGEDKGGGGGGDPPTFISTLPEAIRGHEALKDVKDVGDLAGRFVTAVTPKAFAEQLPEKIRGEAAFKDIKSLDALADSYLNAQKMIGVPKDQILRVPTDDKPESWNPLWNRLGRPEKVEGYKLPAPPEGLAVDENFQKSMLTVMHGEGLTQKQVEKIFGAYNGSIAEAIKTITAKGEAEAAAASGALKTEWGVAYDQKLARGQAALAKLDEQIGAKGELMKALDATRLGNNPAFAKLFDHLGSQLQEDGIIGRASGSEALASPGEARQNIAALQGNKDFMARYNDKRATGHKEAVEQMAALYKQAYPEQGQAA